VILIGAPVFTPEEDRADVEAFMKAAGLRAVADAVRAQSAELEIYGGRDVDYERQQYQNSTSSVFEDHGMSRVPVPQYVTTCPVPEAPCRRTWAELDKVSLSLRLLKYLSIVGLVFLVAYAVLAFLHAIATALAALIVPLLTAAAIVLVVMLLFGMGGGGGKSGGFSGTWWTH
jgi:hypothetical protein